MSQRKPERHSGTERREERGGEGGERRGERRGGEGGGERRGESRGRQRERQSNISVSKQKKKVLLPATRCSVRRWVSLTALKNDDHTERCLKLDCMDCVCVCVCVMCASVGAWRSAVTDGCAPTAL